MFNLVIDLEMCKVPRDYRSNSYKYATETIQIGAVFLMIHLKELEHFANMFIRNMV